MMKKIGKNIYLTDIKAQKGFAWAGFYIVYYFSENAGFLGEKNEYKFA